MSLPRIALSLVLSLTLVGAPAVQVFAMAVSAAPQTAGLHSGHVTQTVNVKLAGNHDQHKDPCGQHDSCAGSCCANCAQCLTGVPPNQFYTEVMQPVLTPSNYRLFFSPVIALRDRPPRTFSF